ncbi:micronuclear linker histone polyprotein-like [Dermacentor albipictus]|uniref:micronuclear linker histone polyprotein-like n=1 Tax=Dermacentor albipictus TaxID=60249 RepID=UPI0038FD3767
MGLYACHHFKAKVEACHNCWRAGHRVDVCPHPKSNRCPRCGVEHQLVEPPTCNAKCILCGEAYFTGCKKCKVRFDRTGKTKSPPATVKVALIEKKATPDSTQQRSSRSPTRLLSDPQKKSDRASCSRTQSRSRSRSTTGRGRTRSRSTSYPPLPGTEIQSTKQVSWGPWSPSLERENKELRAQLQKQSAEIAELREQIQSLLKRDMHTRRTDSPNPPPGARAPSVRPPSAPQASNLPSQATSPTRNPPQKRRAQPDGSGENSQNGTTSMADFANAIQSMQQSLMAMQKDNTAWMANIANRLTALEKRQGTQEATVSQIQTQLNGLLASNSTTSASVAESLHSHHHGSTA